MEDPIQTKDSDLYRVRCTECRQWFPFEEQVTGFDECGIIIGYDGVAKPRPVGFCSKECKEKFYIGRGQQC